MEESHCGPPTDAAFGLDVWKVMLVSKTAKEQLSPAGFQEPSGALLSAGNSCCPFSSQFPKLKKEK